MSPLQRRVDGATPPLTKKRHVRRDLQSRLAFLQYENEPIDRFTSSLEREVQPVQGEIASAFAQPLPMQPPCELAGQPKPEQSTGAMVPFVPSPQFSRMIAAHLEGTNPTDVTQALETVIAKERHDVHRKDVPGRDAGYDRITQLAPKYTAPFRGQLERVVQEQRESGARRRIHQGVGRHLDAEPASLASRNGRGRWGIHSPTALKVVDRIAASDPFDMPIKQPETEGLMSSAVAQRPGAR